MVVASWDNMQRLLLMWLETAGIWDAAWHLLRSHTSGEKQNSHQNHKVCLPMVTGKLVLTAQCNTDQTRLGWKTHFNWAVYIKNYFCQCLKNRKKYKNNKLHLKVLRSGPCACHISLCWYKQALQSTCWPALPAKYLHALYPVAVWAPPVTVCPRSWAREWS